MLIPLQISVLSLILFWTASQGSRPSDKRINSADSPFPELQWKCLDQCFEDMLTSPHRIPSSYWLGYSENWSPYVFKLTSLRNTGLVQYVILLEKLDQACLNFPKLEDLFENEFIRKTIFKVIAGIYISETGEMVTICCFIETWEGQPQNILNILKYIYIPKALCHII